MYKIYLSRFLGKNTQILKEKTTNGLLAHQWFCCMLPMFGMLFTGFNASAQVVTVTGASGTAGPYTTLADAFTAINGTAQTGNAILITISGTTAEPATGAILNAGAWTSIAINPTGGAAATVAGAANAGSPLIDFNGADNVTINGLNTGGDSLTISNTTVSATSGTSTIRFIGGATNNMITNSTIRGAGTMSVATNGATIFFSTDAVTGNGNDNNTISNNDIGPVGSSLPTKAILGNGSTTTTAIGNSGNIMTNNNIFDYFGAAVTSSGIAINGGCNTWSITDNRFYQTGSRTWTSGATHRAIDINNTATTSGAQGFTITGNIIGYASNTQTGTYTLTGSTGKFMGIQFSGITGGTVSNISNNTFASVSLTGVTSSGTSTSSPFQGILLSNGNVICSSNTIGSQSATNSLVFSTSTTTATDVYGIYNFVFENSVSNNNNIGGINVTNAGASGTFIIYGLRANTGTSLTWGASQNTIGGNIANSIQLSATGASSQVIGIAANSAVSNISQSTVRNLTSNIGTGTTSSASVIGISTGTSTIPNHTISQNTIFNLSNTNATAATIVTGIQFTGGSANLVERNLIYGLTSSTNSTAAEINGIRVGGGTTQYRNNMIALGAGVANAIGTAAFNSSTAGIVGFNEAFGTNSIWHNTIYIGGTATAGAGNSYAFNGVQTTNTRSFRNNIFQNSRTNSGATGKHYAVKLNGTAANPAGLTINNNVYFANGASGAIFGFYNSLDVAAIGAWRTAVGQDAGSFEGNPQLLDPTNATPDLHISPTLTTVAEANGADVGVVSDFDAQTRSGLTPVDIGADAGNFVGIDLSAPAITYTDLTNTTSTANRTTSSFATITDVSGVNVTAGTAPRMYYKKSGDANVFNDNTAGTAGWKWVESTTGSSPFDFVIDYALLNSAPVVVNNVIQYFVVAQDLGVPTVGINTGTFAAAPTSVDLTGAAFPIGSTPKSYTILPEIGGTKTVCASGCDYASLTVAGGAFAAINGSVVTSNITLEIAGDLTAETGAISLNEFASPFTVTLKPTSSARNISGTSAAALISLNGADRVTIDGSLSSTVNSCCPLVAASRDLTITNNGATTTSAVVWLNNGANNNTIQNCNIVGNTNTTTIVGLGSGGTIGSPATVNNNNNSYINNNIRRMQIGIYCFGVSSASKDQNTTINLNLINSTAANSVSRGGITAGSQNNLNVNCNQISEIASAGSIDVFAIALGSLSITTGLTSSTADCANSTVTGNVIGSVRQTNTFSAMGILLCPGATGTSLIANNMISGVSANGTIGDFSVGIFVVPAAGSNTRVYNNTVNMQGTQTGGNDKSFALAVGGGTNPTLDIKNNILVNTQNTGSGLNYAIGLGYATFTNITTDNNNLFTTTGALYAVGGSGAGLIAAPTSSVTFANWQATTSQEANSKNVNPVFASATDLHLVASLGTNWCLNGSGVNIPSVTNDLDCQTRNNPPDIGADEFTPTGDAVATPSSQSSGPGNAITTIVLSGTATSFNWTRDNTGTVTGIAASGSGDISGTLINTTASPVTVTFTITPVDAGGCFGPSITATVTVEGLLATLNQTSGDINYTGAFPVSGNFTLTGLTTGAGQGAGVTASIGMSFTNTNPNTWNASSSWKSLAYTADSGDADVYSGNIGPNYQDGMGNDVFFWSPGVYYYATRFVEGANTTYGGVAAGNVGGIWDGATYGNGKLKILTQVRPSQNGATYTSLTTPINAIAAVGASLYTFEFRDSSNVLIGEFTSATTAINFSALSSLATNRVYNIRVKADLAGGETIDYGASVTITLNAPVLPLSQLRPSQCGSTVAANSSAVVLNAVLLSGVSNYEFGITINGGTEQFAQSATGAMNFGQLTSLPGRSAIIGVRVRVFRSGSWSNFGTSCNIFTATTITSIRATQCGMIVPASGGIVVNANVVPGATSYDFEVTLNGGTPQVVTTSNSFFTLSQLSPMPSSSTILSIRVRATVNTIVGAYGNSCNIFTATPISSIRASQCGLTVPANNASVVINANPVAGASNYQFGVIVNGGAEQLINTSNSFLSFSQLSALPGAGSTIAIRVRATVNTIVAAWSASCNVFTPGMMDEEFVEVAKVDYATAYPNPFSNQFTLKLANNSEASIQVLDITGKLISNQTINDTYEVELGQNLETGVYLVRIEQNGNIQNIKMVKK